MAAGKIKEGAGKELTKLISVRVNSQTYKALKMRAVREDTSIQALVNRMFHRAVLQENIAT